GLMVQYGFSVRGLNANPTQEAANGNIAVTAFNDDISGISEFSTAGLYAYPNPVNDMLTITSQAVIDEVTVYNMLGQNVLSATPKADTATINVSALNNGLYIIKTAGGGKETSTQFIKK